MEKESILTATDYVSLQKENELLMNYNQDLIKQLKKKQEIINRLKELNLMINDSDYVYSQDEITRKNLELLSILEDKEV